MEGITPIDAVLVGASGLCWTLVYILTIRRDFADRTYGMPLVALAINIAWEFRFSLLFGEGSDFPLIAQVVNTVWLAFDVVIVYTVFRFGYDAFERDHASAAAPGRKLANDGVARMRNLIPDSGSGHATVLAGISYCES